jgi:hypothetical protein
MMGPPYYGRWCALETLLARRSAFSGDWRWHFFRFFMLWVLRGEEVVGSAPRGGRLGMASDGEARRRSKKADGFGPW